MSAHTLRICAEEASTWPPMAGGSESTDAFVIIFDIPFEAKQEEERIQTLLSFRGSPDKRRRVSGSNPV